MPLAALTAPRATDSSELSAIVQKYVKNPREEFGIRLEKLLVGNKRTYTTAQSDVCALAAALYAHGSPAQDVADCVDAALRYCRAVESCAKAEASEAVALGFRKDAARLAASNTRLLLHDENARLQERLKYGVDEHSNIAKLECEEKTISTQYGNAYQRIAELRKLEATSNRQMAELASAIAKNQVAKKEGLETQLNGLFQELEAHDKEFEAIAARQPSLLAKYHTSTAASISELVQAIVKDAVNGIRAMLGHKTAEHPVVKDEAYNAAFSAWLCQKRPAVYKRWASFSEPIIAAYDALSALRQKQKKLSEGRARVQGGVGQLMQADAKQKKIRQEISTAKAYFTERQDWTERNTDTFSTAYTSLVSAAEEDKTTAEEVKGLRDHLDVAMRRMDDRLFIAASRSSNQPPVQIYMGAGVPGLNTLPATQSDNLDQLPPSQKMSVIRGLLPQVADSVLPNKDRATILMNISKPDSQARAIEAIRTAKIPVNAEVIQQYSKRV